MSSLMDTNLMCNFSCAKPRRRELHPHCSLQLWEAEQVVYETLCANSHPHRTPSPVAPLWERRRALDQESRGETKIQ